ncbi:MAG TPA: hypothetical protein PKY19_07750 [Oscillospiraceae bacterium]|nr:hypothetical protein [Oscillospiraceae bacterium]
MFIQSGEAVGLCLGADLRGAPAADEQQIGLILHLLVVGVAEEDLRVVEVLQPDLSVGAALRQKVKIKAAVAVDRAVAQHVAGHGFRLCLFDHMVDLSGQDIRSKGAVVGEPRRGEGHGHIVGHDGGDKIPHHALEKIQHRFFKIRRVHAFPLIPDIEILVFSDIVVEIDRPVVAVSAEILLPDRSGRNPVVQITISFLVFRPGGEDLLLRFRAAVIAEERLVLPAQFRGERFAARRSFSRAVSLRPREQNAAEHAERKTKCFRRAPPPFLFRRELSLPAKIQMIGTVPGSSPTGSIRVSPGNRAF